MPPKKVKSALSGATSETDALLTFTAITLSCPSQNAEVASNRNRANPPRCCPRYVPLTHTSVTVLAPAIPPHPPVVVVAAVLTVAGVPGVRHRDRRPGRVVKAGVLRTGRIGPEEPPTGVEVHPLPSGGRREGRRRGGRRRRVGGPGDHQDSAQHRGERETAQHTAADHQGLQEPARGASYSPGGKE